MRISAFIDCDSESAVIRVPYELLIDMLKNCRESDDYFDLVYRIHRASARSSKLRKMLTGIFGGGKND